MGHLSFNKTTLKRLFSIGRTKRLHHQQEQQEPNVPEHNECTTKPTWKCFPFHKIDSATNGFHPDNLVGRGGYAEVFKGVLETGEVVAVKRLLTGGSDEQKEREFLTELGTIGHVRHPNVCALLGCCIDHGLHLIFEFSSRGSISSNLHDESLTTMSWKLRYKIAVGSARGLNYLHKGCKRRIIHRDIKASNILLTADFEPQISDFGLARWLPTEWTHRAVAPIEGTLGYLAPEYFTQGIIDEKTDVFAFGVLLLEIISGRKPVDGSHRSLISWAKPYLSHGAKEMVDPRLGEDYDLQQLNKLIFTASLCIRSSAIWRPSMTQVLELLGDGEIVHEQWKMPEEQEEEEDDDDFWSFDDLDDDDDFNTSLSSVSSTGSSSS